MEKHGIDSRLFLALLVCVGSASAQGIPRPEPVRRAVSDGSTAPAVFEGFVLDPDGAPAEGAVVVTSAGGRAVADVSGSYRLEVDVPREATSVQVTAVGSARGNLVASSNVALNGTASTTRVDPLTLSPGSSCSPSWLPTFGGAPQVDYRVYALTTFDDGTGPALYAGGGFRTAGGVVAERIARWDGSSWSALGSGVGGLLNVTAVSALTVFDDGSGPALYAGGSFTIAGGVAARNIAKWDGSSWSALGSGVSGADDFVGALTVFDDGSGPALYAGGFFTIAGGVTANRIAKWDGSSWSALGSGVDGVYPYVYALTVLDDGSGPALYAGGHFSVAGGVAATIIAKWDGSSWSALGSELGGHATGGQTPPFVNALTVFDDGNGSALYAGGDFSRAGSVFTQGIAKWNGASWSTLAPERYTLPNALAVYDDGSGPALHAGGYFEIVVLGGFANRIEKWDGSTWSSLGTGPSGPVTSLEVFDDGGGSALYAGGLSQAGGVELNGLGKWNGSSWASLGVISATTVGVLSVFDDGSGQALYAGGYFTIAGGARANRIARWDGSSWSPLGSGMDGGVGALTGFDDGGGPALYAGGYFTIAGGVRANRIAKWDGSSWSPLRMGVSGGIRALAVYDDGSGPALYAGGDFTTASGVTANHVAKWDGSAWSALGSGTDSRVLSLTVFDDGSGPALYAGGGFSVAGGVAARSIAKWDGTSWTPLGGGFYRAAVNALAVFDAPGRGGPALIAGGEFTSAIDSHDSYLALWRGCPDATAPVLSCPASVDVLDPLSGPPGEIVTFSVTASDDRDASPTVVCVPASGSFFPPGTTIVQCKATDGARNQSNCSFPVNVRRKVW